MRLVGVAMVGSLFSSDAWNNVTFTAGRSAQSEAQPAAVAGARRRHRVAALHRLQLRLPERADPRRHPDTPPKTAWRPRRPASCSGPSRCRSMAAAIMVSTFGCVNGLILAGARVYYTMAQDGLFFRRVGTLDPQDHMRRSSSLVVQCVWAVPAHAQRTVRRSARLCYLCSSAVLHPDDCRPVRAAPHATGYGASVPGLRLPCAAGGVHCCGGSDRSSCCWRTSRTTRVRDSSLCCWACRSISSGERKRVHMSCNLFPRNRWHASLREAEAASIT